MACQQAEGPAEVLLLLEEYCTRRSLQRSRHMSLRGPGQLKPQGPPQRSWRKTEQRRLKAGDSGPPPAALSITFLSNRDLPQLQGLAVDTSEEGDAVFPCSSQTTVTEKLVKITESTPITDVSLETQDDLVQKLVDLMIRFGDDMDLKIQQNPTLQQHLQNLNYDLFQRLTSSVQSQVHQPGPSLSQFQDQDQNQHQRQRQRIAWVFEVTSRLSAIGVVLRRRVLSFGERYIQENHSEWVQQHGGWEEVFGVD